MTLLSAHEGGKLGTCAAAAARLHAKCGGDAVACAGRGGEVVQRIAKVRPPQQLRGRRRQRAASVPSGAGAGLNDGTETLARPVSQKQQASHVRFGVDTKWPLVRSVLGSIGTCQEASSSSAADDEYDLLWSDRPLSVGRLQKLRPYVKVNHFLGMSTITWKHSLCRNLQRMRQCCPNECNFYPETWELPADLCSFQRQLSKGHTFICKPTNSAKGKGIFLTQGFTRVDASFPKHFVAQRYLDRPYLLDGRKFDLRLYVLVIDSNPFQIFLHREGLVRLATEKYAEPTAKNLGNVMMHLTNYSINVTSPEFVENSDPTDGHDGHKRSFQAVLPELARQGCDVSRLLAGIEDLIVKTLLAVQPRLQQMQSKYRPGLCGESMCFELLGFDVLIDQDEKPWLLEVNHAPSLLGNSELDRLVKRQVVKDTLSLLHVAPDSRLQFKRRLRRELAERAIGMKRRGSLNDPRMASRKVRAAGEANGAEDISVHTGFKRLHPSGCAEIAASYAAYLQVAEHLWAPPTLGRSGVDVCS